jgi:hypothetical protein
MTNTLPELMMQIQDVLCTQIPYGGSIISHNTLTNDGLSGSICTRQPRGLPGVIQLVSGYSGSIWSHKIEIWNLYVKNIMFAYSLPTLTSTSHSDHHNRPGGYMSGELKSENIKYQKAPTQRSHHPAKRPTIILSHITKSQKDISTLYLTILQYLKDPQDLQDQTTKTLLNQQDPYGLLFILECNYNQ